MILLLHENLTSNTLSFDVVTPYEFIDKSSFSPCLEQSIYTQKFLLEEATGTWCSSCPQGAYYLQQAVESNPNNIIGAAYHSGIPQYPDPMQTPGTSFWSNY